MAAAALECSVSFSFDFSDGKNFFIYSYCPRYHNKYINFNDAEKNVFFSSSSLFGERERAIERALNTAGCLLVVWIRIDQLEELSQLTFSSVLKIVVGPLLRAWIKLHALLAYAL